MSSADTTKSPTEADIEALVAELKQLRADLSKLGGTVKDTVRHGSAEAAAKMGETAEQYWAEARERAASVARKIEDQPLSAAFTAFGIGFVLGMIFCGRR